jgi:hypothetical protein
MKKRDLGKSFAILVATFATMFEPMSSPTFGDDKERAMQVEASDRHSGRAKIIGYLGRPLGEVVSVRGTWYAPKADAKISSPIYRISHINGKPVAHPIDLTHYRVRPVHKVGRSGRDDKERWDWKAHWGGKAAPPDFKAGEVWEFAGVEACSMKVPVGVWDERGPIVAGAPDIGADGFLATFEFIRARRLNAEP